MTFNFSLNPKIAFGTFLGKFPEVMKWNRNGGKLVEIKNYAKRLPLGPLSRQKSDIFFKISQTSHHIRITTFGQTKFPPELSEIVQSAAFLLKVGFVLAKGKNWFVYYIQILWQHSIQCLTIGPIHVFSSPSNRAPTTWEMCSLGETFHIIKGSLNPWFTDADIRKSSKYVGCISLNVV